MEDRAANKEARLELKEANELLNSKILKVDERGREVKITCEDRLNKMQ